MQARLWQRLLHLSFGGRRGLQQPWHSCYGCRTLVSQGTLYYLSMPVLDGSLAAVTARDPICLYGAICVGKTVFKAWSSPRWTGFLPFLRYTCFLWDLVCVTITFQTTVPSAPALGASKTSHRSAGLADRGRLHHSRVSRVLPEHRGAYAVRSTRGSVRGR